MLLTDVSDVFLIYKNSFFGPVKLFAAKLTNIAVTSLGSVLLLFSHHNLGLQFRVCLFVHFIHLCTYSSTSLLCWSNSSRDPNHFSNLERSDIQLSSISLMRLYRSKASWHANYDVEKKEVAVV